MLLQGYDYQQTVYLYYYHLLTKHLYSHDCHDLNIRLSVCTKNILIKKIICTYLPALLMGPETFVDGQHCT